jgi:hypothetical protein
VASSRSAVGRGAADRGRATSAHAPVEWQRDRHHHRHLVPRRAAAGAAHAGQCRAVGRYCRHGCGTGARGCAETGRGGDRQRNVRPGTAVRRRAAAAGCLRCRGRNGGCLRRTARWCAVRARGAAWRARAALRAARRGHHIGRDGRIMGVPAQRAALRHSRVSRFAVQHRVGAAGRAGRGPGLGNSMSGRWFGPIATSQRAGAACGRRW